MKPYYSPDSNVRGYECGQDRITVRFHKTSRSYTYTYASAGMENIEYMKKLADGQNGLNSFINRCVKKNYI